MSSLLSVRSILATLPLFVCAVPALGHLSYNNRNFGIFSGLEEKTVTITGQTVPNNWGWADGTDGDFAHSHELRFFRFTLDITSIVTISVAALDPSAVLPGFSIYSGLAHASPLDYETDLTLAYLATLPGPTKEGAFIATGTWKMGNDVSATFDDFSTFTYVGHAADGTSANYGFAPGINGDGAADGVVSETFILGPGSYTVGVGGAIYAGQLDVPGWPSHDTGPDGITVSVTVVPEPTTGVLGMGSLFYLGMLRRRKDLKTRD
jgi:hypothetical protein